MENTKTDIFLNRYPTIDLHGFDRETARVAVNDFVLENVFMKNDRIVIIHGKGTGVVKNATHEVLRINKHVVEYKTDNFNPGCTIVKLKIPLE